MQLPEGFTESLQNCDGFEADDFIAAHNRPAPVSIRYNPRKISVRNETEIPWCNNAYYLSERPSFTMDPLFHTGAYYVQEASSMFLDHLMRIVCDLNSPMKILDLCAAPGGKSTLIASLMNENSILVSNEVIRSRVPVLTENMVKWGNENVVITNNDPHDFQKLPGFFDVIVVDAPCSGSGLFRKDKQAIREWSWENVLMCSKRQKRILDDVLPALKPGGILIYSTCSYSKEEDENIISELIGNGKCRLINPKNIFDSVVQNEFGFRFYPDKVEGEGFFISALQKSEDKIQSGGYEVAELQSLTKAEISTLSKWVKDISSFTCYKINENVFIIPKKLSFDVAAIFHNLKVVNAGIEAGRFTGTEFIPAHALALSKIVSDEIPSIHLNKETAINYLRKNPIEIETEIKGWCTVKYEKLNLGWIKIIPGRINNYYPVAWRIRK